MRRSHFLWALLWASGLGIAAAAATTPEEQKIEDLLARVAGQPDMQFIRNGQAYDAATAVSFLRGKWDRQRAEIKTLRDFIEKVATKSSTTGQPYLIKFKDGHAIACREFLNGLLTAP